MQHDSCTTTSIDHKNWVVGMAKWALKRERVCRGLEKAVGIHSFTLQLIKSDLKESKTSKVQTRKDFYFEFPVSMPSVRCVGCNLPLLYTLYGCFLNVPGTGYRNRISSDKVGVISGSPRDNWGVVLDVRFLVTASDKVVNQNDIA